MSGGAVGGRGGGGEPEVTSGSAKETRRRPLGGEDKTLAERQEGWREAAPVATPARRFGGLHILWGMARFEAMCGNNFDPGTHLDFEKM